MQCAGSAKWAFSLYGALLGFGEEMGTDRRRRRQQGAAQRQGFSSLPICQETEVPDLHETGREHMKQETPDELDGIQSHLLLLITVR